MRGIKVKIDKEELTNFVYNLWDKIDPVYKNEVDKSINNFLDDLDNEDVIEREYYIKTDKENDEGIYL